MCTTYNWIQKKGKYKETPLPHKGQIGDNWEINGSMLCGWCEQCRLQKANNWAVRNYYERMETNNAFAVILNYTVNDYNENGEPTGTQHQSRKLITYEDIKLFHKRLRKHSKFRFFLSAEYGELKGHAHYHVIYYNLNYGLDKNDLRIIDKNKKTGKPIYTSDKLNKLWGLGKTRIQPLDHDIAAIYYQTIYQRKPTENFKLIKKYADLNGIKILTKDEINNPGGYIKNITKVRRDANGDVIGVDYIPAMTIRELNKAVRPYMERSTSSKGIGFDSFLKNGLDQWIKCNYQVYINGKQMQIPYSWIVKLAKMGVTAALNCAQKMTENTKHLSREEIDTKRANYEAKRNKNKKLLERKNNTIF